MKNNAAIVYALFLIMGDFIALVAAFVVAYILRVKLDPRPIIQDIPADTYLYAFLTVLPLWILVHASIGLYTGEVYERRFKELGRLLIGSFLGTLVLIGYDFVAEDEIFPARLVVVYGLLLGFSFLVIFRSIARIGRQALFRYGFAVSNVLVIGNSPVTNEVISAISNTKSTGLRVIGAVGRKIEGFRVFTSFQEATQSIALPIHTIIQTELYSAQEKNNDILRYAHENHVSYRFVPGNSEIFVGNIAVELFAGLPMIAVHQTALIGWGRIAKRIFDVFVTSVIIVLLSPLMLAIIVLMKIFEPKGQVFFRQVRLTRFNHEFSVYKFRTHKTGLSGLSYKQAFQKLGQPELYDIYKANSYSLPFKDPRESTIGRFLRVSSLDELPQLFNVIQGDLSLVGPRALIPDELNTYLKKHAILSVKSGITGLAQVSGRKNISFDERRKLDMFYVQNWSFWMDIIILLKTLKAVLSGVGAK